MQFSLLGYLDGPGPVTLDLKRTRPWPYPFVVTDKYDLLAIVGADLNDQKFRVAFMVVKVHSKVSLSIVGNRVDLPSGRQYAV